jgi:hypothetical protein
MALYYSSYCERLHLIRAQLPRAFRDKLHIDAQFDPVHLRAIARFVDKQGRMFECHLEDIEVGGYERQLKIPDSFLAHLSAVL